MDLTARARARELIGAEAENRVFAATSPDTYYAAVRRVLAGWSVDHAVLEHRVPKREVAEGELRCKCGSRRVQSHVLQTRSCDEAASIFARCASCGHAWRM